MRILVFVEPLESGGYSARGGEPFGFTAEGPTPAKAIQSLEHLIEDKLRKGAGITHLEVRAHEHPLLRFCGMYDKDDPMIQEWEKAMQEYRREVDEDPDCL